MKRVTLASPEPGIVGRALLLVACFGVVVAITAMAVGWRLAGRLQSGVDQSLAIAEESLVTTDQAIAVMARALSDVEGTMATVEATIVDTARTLQSSAEALDSVAAATPGVITALQSLQDNVGQVVDAVSAVEGVVTAIGRLPGVPEYAPRESLARSIERLQRDIGPVVTGLTTINSSLTTVDRDVAPLVTNLEALSRNVTTLRSRISESATLLDDYRATTERAQRLASQSRTNLGHDLTTTRVLIVLGGLAFMAGQLVPLMMSSLFFERARLRTGERATSAGPMTGSEPGEPI